MKPYYSIRNAGKHQLALLQALHGVFGIAQRLKFFKRLQNRFFRRVAQSLEFLFYLRINLLRLGRLAHEHGRFHGKQRPGIFPRILVQLLYQLQIGARCLLIHTVFAAKLRFPPKCRKSALQAALRLLTQRLRPRGVRQCLRVNIVILQRLFKPFP